VKVNKPLPDYCYSSVNLQPGGVVIHYFSAINVAPNYAFDPDTCYDLLLDLNSAGEHRGLVMEPVPGPRFYASYHEIIDRNGTVYQLTPYDHVAYHAGASTLHGRNNLNRWTYGIALLGTGDSGFTDDQYAAAQLSVAQKMSKDRFTHEWIAGHDQVAIPRGRKHDPGTLFDWRRFLEPLKSVVQNSGVDQ